jgi:outer membrane receptor for ferrienterochelin and colicins
MAMRFGRQLCAALVLSLCAAASLAAQQTGTLSGRVTDAESGTPIATVDVQVRGPGGQVVASGQSDQEGNFRIANVPAGRYALVFSHITYEQRREDVRVAAGETAAASARLSLRPLALGSIIVTGSKVSEKALAAPSSNSKVNNIEIQEKAAVTPVEHVRSLPGIDYIQTGVQGVNVVARGFNNIFSGALHTLTDYRIAGVPSLRVNFMHFIPQTDDDFDRIEVVLGPASALYGPNTSSGVLHFLTKSPLDEQGTRISLTGGLHTGRPADNVLPGVAFENEPGRNLFQATFRTAQKLSETFGIKLSGQYVQADEFLYRDNSEDGTKLALPTSDADLMNSPVFPPGMPLAERRVRAARIGNRDFDILRWSGDVRADWRPSAQLNLVVSGGITNDNSIELTGIGAGQAVDWRYMYAQTRANYRNWFAQTYVNMSDAGETYLLRNGAPITDRSKVWVSQLQHQMNLGTRQSFTYGADYIATMPETEGTINGSREDDDNYNEVGAYLQSKTALHRMFDVVLAGRYDKHSELPDAVFSPRAALVFKPSDAHTFRVTYNRAFSTPTSLNLFLDIDAGPAGPLGAFGFRAHAQGPGRDGINLHAPDGSLQIRTPFAGLPTDRTLRPVSLAAIYDYQVEAIRRAANLPAQLVGALLLFKQDATFNSALSMVLLDPLTRKTVAYSPSAVTDVPVIEESTNSTFEVGYKAVLGEKLGIAVDAWWSQYKNFTSPLIAATPLVMVNPAQLTAFLLPRLTAAGVPAATAQQIVEGMRQIPGGVVSSPEANGLASAAIITYRNFGDVDLSGFDVSATANLTDSWTLAVTGSLVSDDFFNLPVGTRDSTVVALNAPKRKASARLTYRNAINGLNAEARVRYTGEFPANSAGFVGLNCVDAALQGDCVKSYTLFDLTGGYRLPIRGASLQLSVNNLFNDKYQSFIGVPPVRRMALLRLRYDF